jgi:CubicO group peptidase (beta-lactamase class C family)
MLLFCAAPCLAHAQDKAPLTVALDKIVDGMDKGRDAPGGAVTVSIDNKIVYNRAFGSADLEHGVDFTPETVSETGSVAKQFTAAAILLLVNEGKLSLDDDIRKYFPELPDYGDVIQVRNLLTHTSGLKDWGSVLALGGAPRGTRAYIMADALACIFRQKTLNFPPGTMYFYSNSNYILLGELVHRVSKTSFTEFTRKRSFEPAGMTHTLWRSNFRDIIKNRAIAYSYDKAGKKYMLDMPFDNVYAAGGLLTTTEDLLKWNQCWAEDRFGPSLSEMRTTRGVLKNKSSIDYALGAVFMKNSHGVGRSVTVVLLPATGPGLPVIRNKRYPLLYCAMEWKVFLHRLLPMRF